MWFPPSPLLKTFISSYEIYCVSSGLCFVWEYGCLAHPPSRNEFDVKEHVPAFDKAQGQQWIQLLPEKISFLALVWNAVCLVQKHIRGVIFWDRISHRIITPVLSAFFANLLEMYSAGHFKVYNWVFVLPSSQAPTLVFTLFSMISNLQRLETCLGQTRQSDARFWFCQ